MKKYLIALLGVCLAFSCSTESESDKDDDIIREANIYLSDGNCEKAQSTLVDVSDGNNPFYIKTLAASYACESDFNEINFVSNDMSNLNTSQLLNSLATFSTSRETTVNSTEYVALKNGIRTILYSGSSTAPVSSSRTSAFGVIEKSEMNLQAMFMILAHLGKWFQYYGSADGTGTKTDCLIDYTDAATQAYITGASTGACADFSGHADLDIGTIGQSEFAARICDPIVHFNHLLDIVLNTTLSSNDSLAELSNIASDVQSIITAATTVDSTIAPIFAFYTYSSCISFAEDAANLTTIERYFAVFFETNFL
ncbi:MAG: hypothetical protein H6621_03385 [Halobacteriovoraceae bacterium]|nr:hypothetical protein [Halobacteriovoraceae bacterium]MCB9094090.1 hypothetical protein [Halobacteriovoraceae bacterium]